MNMNSINSGFNSQNNIIINKKDNQSRKRYNINSYFNGKKKLIQIQV